jgi:hypothetical protein
MCRGSSCVKETQQLHKLALSVEIMSMQNKSFQSSTTYPDAGNSDRLGPSSKFVENSTKLTCFEINGYRIKYGTVLWLVEFHIRRGRKV